MIRRFVASTRGVAAIEFAMVLPVLLLMFLASFDGGRAIAIYMKVRSATYTLSAITNQYTAIHDVDMQAILGATAVVLAPYPPAPVVVVISQLSISAAGQTTATVSWSSTLNGTARTVGSSVNLPTGLNAVNNNTCGTYPCYLIFGEVSYVYTPMFGYFVTSPLTLADNLFVTPRSSASIQRSSP